MGRSLGSHGADDSFDRPDLNKCPDCDCFFEGDCCPLCGKECPEEMRAGNRKTLKQKKSRDKTAYGRYVFVDWYHKWWFIILMLIIFPVAGLILLATSPHKKSVKLTVAAVAIIYGIISTFGLGTVIARVTNMFVSPVDTSMTEQEYIASCEVIEADDYYRSVDRYTDSFVCVTAAVSSRIIDFEAEYTGDRYSVYYLCDIDGAQLLIRDCTAAVSGNAITQNFLPGDVITVYGEGAGSRELPNLDYVPTPCVNAAYITLAQ